jgi:23S rRNA (adenine2030-N6)-methyltransferase
MNYRHAFHAGGFADVVKHAVLARILVHLKAKPAAFRVIDTHAGAGRYDLSGPEATRTGEWRDGIARLLAARLDRQVEALLAPFLDVVATFNPGGKLSSYPGSPTIARAHLRPQDRLLACELEPGAARALSGHLGGDDRVRVVAIDGWTALAAYVPPKERRGIVLVDPAFELPDEFARLADGLAVAHGKWASGTYLLWYPIKQRGERDAFVRRLRRLAIPKTLRAELEVGPPDNDERLRGSGLIVVNPPWTLERELATLLPALAAVLARDHKGGVRLDWLAPEQ